jgi:hypothetical protein
LEEAPIPEICLLIKECADLHKSIQAATKEFQGFDSDVDKLIIVCGLVEVETQITEYREKQKELRTDLQALSDASKQVLADCKEYIDYASDIDERNNMINCKQALDSMTKTFSTAQIDGIGKEVDRLNTQNNALKNSLNTDDVIADGLKQIGKINKRFTDAGNNIATGWINFQKRRSQLKDFDLIKKRNKRRQKVRQCENKAKKCIEKSTKITEIIEKKLKKGMSEENTKILQELQQRHSERDEKITEHKAKVKELLEEVNAIEISDDIRSTEHKQHDDFNI